jgi:hypothetical protein
MLTENKDIDIESIKAELMAECDAIVEFYAQVDEKVLERFFPDPIAWDAIQAIRDAGVYENLVEYLRYYLGCEIQQSQPMDRNSFQLLPPDERTELSEKAYRL